MRVDSHTPNESEFQATGIHVDPLAPNSTTLKHRERFLPHLRLSPTFGFSVYQGIFGLYAFVSEEEYSGELLQRNRTLSNAASSLQSEKRSVANSNRE
ncbi:hypothetical protein PHLCEN_2v10900 [Hermanssonia centrifuga]|uniref:Uncharacterized protein n=1 Tax=Hermanssonia centrifuga TaxID=98765 RepID=A0A2R6NLV2_9APHY|nr:hypothetical protein PHLCEN_2v10900 [Hermanssonia centrifuga]